MLRLVVALAGLLLLCISTAPSACEAWFDTERQRVVIPQMWVGSAAYRVELALSAEHLNVVSTTPLATPDSNCSARYNPTTLQLTLPTINLSGSYFEADAQVEPALRLPLKQISFAARPREQGLTGPTTVEHNLPLTASVAVGPLRIERVFPSLAFERPVLITQPPAERRLFVVEQGGLIQAFPEDGSGAPEIFLDIRDKVSSSGEMGLLGLAFDPNYAETGHFFVYYSAPEPHRSVVSRFSNKAGPGSAANPASEKIILEVDQPYSNHNAGMIAFGPDGYLYIALGDGGSGGDPQGHGQNPETLLGSILRIDPRGGDPYAVPADNPFVGVSGFRDEIWAYGLRNPYRFCFDRQTGDLWAGDVGQNSFEEIDLIVAGGNYGWNRYEAETPYHNPDSLPLSDFHAPVWSYGRDQGVSVTGGCVYRGQVHPDLAGRYLFGDFGSGAIWAMSLVDGVAERVESVGSVPLVSGFGEDRHGELYMLSYNGEIYAFQSGQSEPTRFPDRLSETGLFTDVATLEPAAGLIPYDVNAPLWSDGTYKRRWLALPPNGKIGFNATEAWDFPLGSVLIKHFELELSAGDPGSRKRLETRLMLRQQDQWRGLSYRWDDAHSDAFLLSGAVQADYTVTDPQASSGSRVQSYHYPSEAECMRCHNQAAGAVLGLTTRQMNRDHIYGAVSDNQLRALSLAGRFDRLLAAHQQYQALADTRLASGAPAARAYLDANCAFCHRPNAPVPVAIDLRHDVALAEMGLVNQSPANGQTGKLLLPGDGAGSVLLQRMLATGNRRMPPLASGLVDSHGSGLVKAWIDALPTP